MPPKTTPVDVALSRVIMSIESSGNPHALRFEPLQYAALQGSLTDKAMVANIAKRNYCNTATALVIASTSFGAYQLMGSNLYDLAWNSDIANFLTDPASQAIMFGEFLDAHAINFTMADMLADSTKLLKFAKVYNGSTAYAVSMRTAAAATRNMV